MMAFQLSKWYLDCVTDSGDASIVYAGDLNWGPVHLHFSSLLCSRENTVTQKHSLREQGSPILAGSSISWNPTVFGIAGQWQADSVDLRETVFRDERGSVEWQCLMPRAQVRIGNESGLGYAERLSMTIAPWKIPIQDLRWGRFCSRSDWAVWIDWYGEYSKRIVYLNGKSAVSSTINDQQIRFDDGSRLIMDQSLILRKGPLGTTALSSIPGVSKTFPARLLQVDECKWRSHARLERPGCPPADGWAIHEIVHWPK